MILASNGIKIYIIEHLSNTPLSEQDFAALLASNKPQKMFLLELQLAPSQDENGKINYGALINHFAAIINSEKDITLKDQTMMVIPAKLNICWFKEILPDCELFQTIKTKYISSLQDFSEFDNLNKNNSDMLKKMLKELKPEHLNVLKEIIALVRKYD